MKQDRIRWYDQYRWTKRSRQQLREHPLCKKCLDRGWVAPAEVADHVVPHKGDYQSFWFGDLQSLCRNCHESVKKQEEGRGYSTEIGIDGWPTDPAHPANKREK
jgi:5-methylcytosine-specific restriction enzyme A